MTSPVFSFTGGIYAAFVVARVAGARDRIAATTRPGGRLGLPGGKLEAGETIEAAARREAREEGWAIPASARLQLVRVAPVDGRPVAWLVADQPAAMLAAWKEQARGIVPVAVPLEAVAAGLGNEWILQADPLGLLAEGRNRRRRRRK